MNVARTGAPRGSRIETLQFLFRGKGYALAAQRGHDQLNVPVQED